MGRVCLHSDVVRIVEFYLDISMRHVLNFWAFFTDFMRIFLDDLSVFGAKVEHVKHLQACFEKCKEAKFSLIPQICVFLVQRGHLLGHVFF